MSAIIVTFIQGQSHTILERSGETTHLLEFASYVSIHTCIKAPGLYSHSAAEWCERPDGTFCTAHLKWEANCLE